MSLLSPHDRTPLLETLRPPADHVLHTALATTYSLDLIAMMVAPVGFTFFELDENAGSVSEQTPLELLEAIRCHAGQMVLFCEAGRIAVPSKHRQLFTYLEDRIVQVRAPKEGRAFHPKVWFLRYVGPDDSVRYRLLCLSRNLTFDQSLDSILMLEGPLRADRTKGFGHSAALKEFVAALPGMALAPLNDALVAQCALVESEIARVDWDIEDLPFDEYQFWPLGHTGKATWPFSDDHTRILIASPFVSGSTLKKLTDDGDAHILISRRDELEALPKSTFDTFKDVYTLRAQPETGEEVADDPMSSGAVAANDLHAKLYIADRGWNASIWTGSANATAAAFSGNVEFLVELAGKKSRVGIDVFFQKHAGGLSMTDLLEPFAQSEPVAKDPAAEALDEALDLLRLEIARKRWTVRITAREAADEFAIVAAAEGDLPEWTESITVRCRPLSLAREAARPLVAGSGDGVAFDSVSLEGLTSFLAFEASGRVGDRDRSVKFVVNARLIGEPANRKDRILQGMLRDKRSVVRFLLLLLSEAGEEFELGAGDTGAARIGRSMEESESEALLEPLLRAFERSPGRIAAVASLVRELESTAGGSALVPEGLGELIGVIEAAIAGGAR